MLVLPVPGSRARTGCGTVQGMSDPVQSPVFVGRREEIESLAALLRRAADGEPGFAIVAGEAGVGKTRLVTELTGQAADFGFTVLAGHCVELGAEGLPLAPLIDALRTLARTTARAELADVLVDNGGQASLGDLSDHHADAQANVLRPDCDSTWRQASPGAAPGGG